MSVAPRVSVLLPAYNAAATLGVCLRSLARQTESDWECVVVDDGSTDDTAAVARSFAERDRRFRLSSGPHRGLVGALASGLERCRAPYVARMDADDLMHRRRLAEQLDALDRRPELAAVGCHVRMFPRNGLGDGNREYESWLNSIGDEQQVRREAFVECPVAHPAMMIRTDVLREAGYRDAGWPEDYDLVLRLLESGRRIGVVPRRLLAWRHDRSRLSRTDPRYAVERFTACKAHFLARLFLGDTDRYILWGYGGTGRSLAAALREHGKSPSHVVDVHTGRLGNRIGDAPVVEPDALPGLERLPVVVSVAGRGPREEIRAWMAARGFRELDDFVCAA